MSSIHDTPRRRSLPTPPMGRTRDERTGSTINIHVHTAKRSTSKHSDAKGSVSKVVAGLAALSRQCDAITAKLGKTADSFDRAAGGAHRVADARRLSSPRVR